MLYQNAHYLALDTNTWIYLANGMEPVKLLRFIEQAAEAYTLRILIPELVITEWHKNKKDAIEKGVLKHLSELNTALDRILQLVGDNNKSKKDLYYLFFDNDYDIEEESEQEGELIREIIGKFKEKRKSIEKAVHRNIKSIERLFTNATIIKPSSNVYLKAGQFAVDKKAPFLKKNSFADAIILFGFIEYIERHEIADAIFVSYNIEDFCKRENGKAFLHPDLVPEFDRSGSHFYHVLGEAINEIQENLMSLEELEALEELRHQFYEEEEEIVEYCQKCFDKDSTQHAVEFGARQALYDERVSSLPDVQLKLDIVKHFAKKKRFEILHSIIVGSCVYCEAEHFKCASCGSLNSVDEEEYDWRLECSTCRMPYYIDTVDIEAELNPYYMRGSDEAYSRYRILKDRKYCQKCDREYRNFGPSVTLCEQCEDEEFFSQL